MNKISLINNKTKESNNKRKKNKFKKFLSSSMAVMVLSVGLAAPMTLRGEETEKKTHTINDVKEKLDRIEEKLDKTIKMVEEKKAEELKKIEEAKIEYCSNLEKNIPLMRDYCSKNKCDEEQNKILTSSLKDYKELCEKLVTKKE